MKLLFVFFLFSPFLVAETFTFDRGFNGGSLWEFQIRRNFTQSYRVSEDGKTTILENLELDDEKRQFIIRLKVDGTADQTLQGTGKVLLPRLDSGAYTDIAIDRNGRIYLFGYTLSQNVEYVSFVERLTQEGSKDLSFNGNGKTLLSEAFLLRPPAFFVDEGGKIQLVTPDGTYFRLDSRGSFDTSLAGTGILKTGMRYAIMSSYADGRTIFLTNVRDKYILTRFNSDGTLDKSFNGSGAISWIAAPSSRALLLQKDGKILCSSDTSIYRFNDNGTIDISFGEKGKTDFHSSFDHVDSLHEVSSGILVGANFSGNSSIQFLLLTYDGKINSHFGDKGVWSPDLITVFSQKIC